MEDSLLAEVALPVAIVLIMIAMGMTLTKADFVGLADQKRSVVVGMVAQLLLLPAIGFLCAWLFGLETVFAIGMVLLAAAPGGSTSNLIVHLADLDRALSLALTSLSNIVVFVSMPVYLALAQDAFGSLDGDVAVPVGDLVLQVAALTVIPIAIGMLLRAKRPALAERLEGPGKQLATVVFLVIVAGLVVENWQTIVDEVPNFGAAFVTMNLVALAAGWGVATAARLPERDAGTIGLEVGIQNGTLAIAVALSVFDNDDLALVPGLYGLWMLFTGFAFAFFMRQRLGTRATTPAV